MYPLKGSPRSGGIFIEGLSGFDKGSRGELGEHGQMTRRSTNHGLQGDYREEHIKKSKHIQDPIRLLLDTVSTKIKVVFVAGEDVQGRSLDDVQQLTKQVQTAACLSQSGHHKFAVRLRLPYPSPLTLRPIFVRPSVFDVDKQRWAHFHANLTWALAGDAGASGCEGKAGGLLTKAELWDCLAYDYSYGIFVEIFSLQVLELGLAASVFTLYHFLVWLALQSIEWNQVLRPRHTYYITSCMYVLQLLETVAGANRISI